MNAATLRLETPEGIDLELRPAGPVPRGLALLVDESIAQLGCLVVLILLSFAGRSGVGVYLVVLFLVEWFYPVLFEVLRGGQTPGKKWMGLRVLDADATPIGWNASLIRNLLRVADVLPLFYLTGLVSLCMTRSFQRLGDLAAGTIVVHTETALSPEGAELARAETAALGSRRVSIPLEADEQRALLSFGERQSELSVARSAELSDLLAPLSGETGESGRVEVLRIANGLSGDE